MTDRLSRAREVSDVARVAVLPERWSSAAEAPHPGAGRRRRLPGRGARRPGRLLPGVGPALPPDLTQRGREHHCGRPPAPTPTGTFQPDRPLTPYTCGRQSCSRAVMSCWAGTSSWPTARYACCSHQRTPTATCTATRPATSSSTSSPARRPLETQLRSPRGRQRRLRGRSRPARPTAGCSPGDGRRCSCSKRPATSAFRDKYLTDRGQLLEGAPFSERDLRGPGRARWCSTATTSPVLVRNRAGPHPAGARRPPVRRRRAGTAACIRSRSRSTTSSRSSGCSTSRRRCIRRSTDRLRRLLLRAAALRLPPRRGEGPVPPRQRRLRRGALLLRRRLHEPGRLRHRRRIDHRSTRPASCTARSPAAWPARSTPLRRRRSR